MKRRSRWSIVFFDPASAGRLRHWGLSGAALIVCAVVLLVALGGVARLGYFACSFALARFGLVQERNENRVLMQKMQFLAKFTEREARKKEQLAAFENTVRLKYGMDEISPDVWLAGVGGKPTAEELAIEALKDPAVNRADSIKSAIVSLIRQVELQNATLSGTVEQVREMHRQWSERPSTWPAYGRITSTFGYRIHPFTGYPTLHEGIDISNEAWTPVFATANGVVRFAGYEQYYGNMIVIDHPAVGCATVYAHLVQLPGHVPGQVVRRGDLIGYMGNTGRSTGTHLHYEIRKLDRPVDPLGYVVPSDVLVD